WAKSAHTALEWAVVATDTMRSTPTARARSITAGRSCWNCSSSRWACVSISLRATLARDRLRMRHRQSFQFAQMPLFYFQELLDLETSPGIDKGRQVLLKVLDALALAVHQQGQ